MVPVGGSIVACPTTTTTNNSNSNSSGKGKGKGKEKADSSSSTATVTTTNSTNTSTTNSNSNSNSNSTASVSFIKKISSMYPGRASSSPIIDLFITLLSMGIDGYQQLLKEREENRIILLNKVHSFCDRHGGVVLAAPSNDISIAISLPVINDHPELAGFLGAMLYQRNISGCRVVSISNKVTKIGVNEFINWGCHSNLNRWTYMTIACAIGMKRGEIDVFMDKLEKTYSKFVTTTTTTSSKSKNSNSNSNNSNNNSSSGNISSSGNGNSNSNSSNSGEGKEKA